MSARKPATEPARIDPSQIPRRIFLPRSAMLEGFQRLGGLRFFIRGILRTYGAAKEDVQLVTTAVDGAVEEKEAIELSIKVGSRGTWTMVLTTTCVGCGRALDVEGILCAACEKLPVLSVGRV